MQPDLPNEAALDELDDLELLTKDELILLLRRQAGPKSG